MDFFTTHQSTVPVNIDGKAYSVPRFLTPALTKWAAEIKEQDRNDATAHLSADEKARFLRYFPDPAIDIADMLRRARASDGAEYVVGTSLRSANVPDDAVKSVLANSDPMMIRNLAEELTLAGPTLDKLGANDKDPLASPPAEAGGSQETGQPTTQDSSTSTPA